jgi:hypothetical protein
MYRTKTKALAVLIRNESANHMLESSNTDTADIIITVLEWAAQNMESLARGHRSHRRGIWVKNTTIDLATVTCSIGQLHTHTHLRDETVPNMRLISEKNH